MRGRCAKFLWLQLVAKYPLRNFFLRHVTYGNIDRKRGDRISCYGLIPSYKIVSSWPRSLHAFPSRTELPHAWHARTISTVITAWWSFVVNLRSFCFVLFCLLCFFFSLLFFLFLFFFLEGRGGLEWAILRFFWAEPRRLSEHKIVLAIVLLTCAITCLWLYESFQKQDAALRWKMKMIEYRVNFRRFRKGTRTILVVTWE